MKATIRLVTAATVALGAMTLAIAAPGAASAGGGIALPDDPDAQVVNLDNEVVVYADGRVFRRTPDAPAGMRSPEDRPGMLPAPPPSGFEIAHLTDEGLTWLLEQADEFGMLFDEPDYGDPLITDVPYVNLTVTTGDGEFRHTVFAPGVEVDDRDAQERRDRFAKFTSILGDLDSAVGNAITDFEPWVPDAWVVSVEPWLGTADREWPMADVPTAWPACVVLPSDADADTATGAYVVLVDGAEVVLIADAALPGTADCPPEPAGPLSVTGIAVPSDPDAIVLDVEQGSIVVLADGRVFRSLAIDDDLALVPAFSGRGAPAAAPPPRSPSGYEVATLTEEGLQRLLQLAGDAGLFVNEPDYGDGPTDQGYFDIVINAHDEHYEHHVYAPGFDAGDPVAQERRDQLFGFLNTLRHIDDEFGDDIGAFENFVPDRWLVTVRATRVAGPNTWPVDGPPVEGCVALPSDADTDTMSGVYYFEGDVEAVIVVVAPVIVDAMCDD